MNVSDILASKDARLVTVRPADTLETAATLLYTNKIGAMPVRDTDGRLAGILSERDIVRALCEFGPEAHGRRVRELMSSPVVTCAPDDSLHDIQARMDARGIRHLPVVEAGRLIGVISQRDVVHLVLLTTQMERNVLRDVALARA